MKRIKPEDLPAILSEETITILVEMAMEFPKKTFEWAEISEILEKKGQLNIILNRIDEIQLMREKERQSAMSESEKVEDAAKWARIKNDPDPHKFYGNMGQPETPQEFKNRYGVWPPGYDENGNKV